MKDRTMVSARKPCADMVSLSKNTRTEYSQSGSSTHDKILSLQKTIGNYAVQKLIKSGALQAKFSNGHHVINPGSNPVITNEHNATIRASAVDPGILPKCGPDATDWFIRQLTSAMTDPAVLAIQGHITAADAIARRHGTTAQEVAEGGTAAAVVAQVARMGRRAPAPNPVIAGQLAAGAASGAAAASALSSHPIDAGRIAYHIGRAGSDWARLVNHGARYDFKAHVMRSPTTPHCPDSACSDTITLCPGAASENCYLTDLPGNLFYARIGRFAGWSELTLQLGSQLAQLTGTGAWDPPQDTAAIHLGFHLPVTGLCGMLPGARGSLTSRSGCGDCTERTTAPVV